jgi:hypothetical protein
VALVYFDWRRQTPSPRERAGRICTFRWRVVKWYHKGLWNLYSRFESWPASHFPGEISPPCIRAKDFIRAPWPAHRNEAIGLV